MTLQFNGGDLKEAAVVLLRLAYVDGVVLEVEVQHNAAQPLLRLACAVCHLLSEIAEPPQHL